MQDLILQVKNLSVSLAGEQILSGVNFSVNKGEALAIVGPNGAGKSVLFKALLGLLPHTGSVEWKKNLHIGYIPQKLSLDPQVPATVKELFLLKSPHFWSPSKNFLGHLKHELDLVGLPMSLLEKPASSLSGGQFQRLLIAWAMLNHPEVLFFDEPTAGVDAGFEETVYQLMHRLQEERGTTIFLISHDLNVVYRYAQQVICLNRKVICSGPPEEILTPAQLRKIYGESGFYAHEESRTHHHRV